MTRLVESQNARMVVVDTQGAHGLLNAGLKNSTYFVTR